jgi:hypothetical protein
MKLDYSEVEGTPVFGSPCTLVGLQVVLDAHSQGLCYLLLARPCAVGEELSFSIVRDKDGLRYGRRHVALEEDA